MFHTRSNDRRFRHKKRHCLLLHVRSHQRTGVIVVVKERDEARSNRYRHSRRNVYIIHLACGDFYNFVSFSYKNSAVDEASLFVDGLACLSDYIIVLDIGCHILNYIGKLSGFLIDLAVRSLDKAVVIEFCVARKI